PRSWCSCDRPNRSACSISISVAFGTSTPTSMTDVHQRCVRHIDADFDDRCGHEQIQVAGAKSVHDLVFDGVVEPAVQQADAKIVERTVLQLGKQLRRRSYVERLRFLHERTNDKRLPALAQRRPELLVQTFTVLLIK